MDNLQYESVTVYGVANRPAVIVINGMEHGAFSFDWEKQVKKTECIVHSTHSYLTFITL